MQVVDRKLSNTGVNMIPSRELASTNHYFSLVKVQVLVANLKDRFKFHKFSAQFFGNHCFSLVLYNWSWQSYNGAVLKKLNVHGLIWLGNDTVSLWHGILYGMVLLYL